MSLWRAVEPIEQRLFTVEEYHRMAEAGILSPDERVELISRASTLDSGARVSPVSWPDIVIDVAALAPDLTPLQ